MVIIILNTYPITISRDIVFRSKENSLKPGAIQIGASVEMLERVTPANIELVMGMLETGQFSYITVLSSEQDILYYQGARENGFDESVAKRVIDKSLRDCSDEFISTFSDGVFRSYSAVPILSQGEIVAIVFAYEYDKDEGALITGLRSDLFRISIALGVLTILISLIYSRTFTKKITKILNAIGNVREGEYTYRIDVKGNDELAQLGDEFNSLTGRLQETEQIRRRFVADASHELKTPLASIKLLSDSILETPGIDQATVNDFVTDIRDESERLSRITAQLLNLTRLDNRLSAASAEVNCCEIGERVARSLRPIADAAGVKLKLHLEPDAYIMATGDELFQIIFNLGENAIKYNIEGGSVYIHIFKKDKFVSITVDDTGIGIPDRDIPYIFDRFYRVDKSRGREEGGSGLGLSIVKSTAERHGGEVSCEKSTEGGMRFTVRFPAYEH